ncbi:DNA-directed DNA polymerase, family A, palm domain containing protein [uncultured Caudovirales phage]|uniref:DNA-directed DNA polymerase, family A, palm domain containing protein n=1 Tax=uncultured Caudovirales phage TaxID=2100421 RepID=A0A6J5NXD6_9CAUD|nr:DNA-directed DNA polymerase, family A, palm domain containing protein [uncultured Caudovirales phage]
MQKLWLDLETYSETPIKNGVHAYAENVEILLFAWAIDDEPVEVWDATAVAAMPSKLYEALSNARELWAQNSHFDRTVLGAQPIGDGLFRRERWRDTMVQALAHGLPGALGDLCVALGIPADKAKDKAGKALIQLFCKPRPKNSKIRRATRETHPAQWAEFVEYARLDIEAMREAHKRMPIWNYRAFELDLWHLDQRINDRGVAIDLELADAAVRGVDRAQVGLAKDTVEMTNGQVQSATQRDAMLAHILEEYGIALPDMQMSTIERRIADPDLPFGLRELLKVRLQASTSSTSKYRTLQRATSSDGRLRGLLQFCGASRTGRWAGRLFQPQNLPRPTLHQDEIDFGIEALKADCADLVVDNVMQLTSSAIRGCIVAPQGKKLCIADLSNIEGRVQAWLAGESWKLKAFRDYDTGVGADLYKLAYSKSFGVAPEDVTKDQRQIGKILELSLGYEGGVGAFVTFSTAYGIDLDELAAKAARSIPPNVWGQANIMLEWHRSKNRDPDRALGLSERAWLTCESFKLAWREAHPNIAALWKDLDNTVRAAIDTPAKTYICGVLKIRRDGSWLRIGLPSGRALCYPSPAIEKGSISYMGINQYSRKWCRLTTYGGKLFENICQAVARDVMAYNMPQIEAKGYEIVLSVHDELLTETPDDDGYSSDELSELLAAPPAWALDMPLAAAGFETYRYKKD